MDRELFRERLERAAARARELAVTWVHEPLPRSLRFRVELNRSYDGNPLDPDERVFPEDSASARGLAYQRCTIDEVVELLWRERRVPEWIDLSVSSRLADATLIEALCCGRFTDNSELLYHAREGYPPFHVLSPTLPAGYDHAPSEGVQFSVFDRAESCALDELPYLATHADQIWSLALYGREFDDEGLAALPRLRKLELLVGHGSSTSSSTPGTR